MPIDGSDGSDVIEIRAFVRRTAERAIAIWDGSCDASGTELWTWLPKSLIEYDERKREVTILLPKWLARDRGLAADVGALQAEVEQLRERVQRLEARLEQIEGVANHRRH